MSDVSEAISVKAIAELLRRIEARIGNMDYQRASGMCLGAAAMLDGIVAETRSNTPVLLLPPPTPSRDTSGRFVKAA